MPITDPEERRRYQREWRARRRRAWLDANGPCRCCGSWDDLEVDHIDPGSKISHNVWSWAEPRRVAELAKCQVLCRDCHIDKTLVQPTRARGERQAGAKLTEGAVRELRRLRSAGLSWNTLADRFGISKDLARYACDRGWRHVV